MAENTDELFFSSFYYKGFINNDYKVIVTYESIRTKNHFKHYIWVNLELRGWEHPVH